MHDRRVDGETLVFGNRVRLYNMNMTWFDHQTESTWTQLGGKALDGPYEGAKLKQVPAYTGAVQPWIDAHPDTKVLVVPNASYGVAERLKDDFVIGVSLDGAAAFDYRTSAGETAVNHFAGTRPVLVYVDRETQAVRVFEREVEGRVLSFRWEESRLEDIETGSIWDPMSGWALAGPLKDERLQPVPYTLAYNWAWGLFYEDSTYYPETGN